MRSIAVFCGSSVGNDPVFEQTARNLGTYFAENELTLVYGGGSIGLMGVLADTVMALGGEVIGVIPKKLKDMEVGHDGITKLHVVGTMHERKAMMAKLSDGFIAMPGGIGTIEEIVEVYTWLQLGYHHKPCGFLNVNGYYDLFFQFLDHMVHQGFLKQTNRQQLLVSAKLDLLVEKMEKLSV